MNNLTELEEYLEQAFNLYRKDPPDSSFQRGYLAGLLEISVEIGMDQDKHNDLYLMYEEN